MTAALLTERDVLVLTSWPSVSIIDREMRSGGFPRPARLTRGIGRQWSAQQVLDWMGVDHQTGRPTGEATLLGRFS